MTTLNLHNNTLTYILVCIAIAVVLGILFHFYRKYVQDEGKSGAAHERRKKAAGNGGATQHESARFTTTVPIFGNDQNHPTGSIRHTGIQPALVTTNNSPKHAKLRTHNINRVNRLSRDWGEVPRSQIFRSPYAR